MLTKGYCWLVVVFAVLCVSVDASAQKFPPDVWLPVSGQLNNVVSHAKCDPNKDYTPSLNNVYYGTAVAPELGLNGQVRLILEGNQWVLKNETGGQIGGTYSAKTTCRYTSVAFKIANPHGKRNSGSFSVKAIRVGDQIKLQSALNEVLAFTLDPLTLLPEVTIETAPAGGRVELISKSDYDALDPNDKPHWPWRSVSGTARLSGIYHFRITWSDAAPVEGDKNVDTAHVIFP